MDQDLYEAPLALTKLPLFWTARKGMEATSTRGSVQHTIALFTSNILHHILQLAFEDRHTLTALLRWDPTVSDRLAGALRDVDSAFHRLSFEEEYLFILRDLESSIQQAPLIWAEVATINVRLDSLSGRISQVAPRSHSLIGYPRIRGSTETSLFHNAQHILITGGNFTIHSTQNTPDNISQTDTPPFQSVDGLGTTESYGENIFCPLRRMFVCIKHAIVWIARRVEGAVRRGCRA
ncbi:hypothetical protein D9613_012419 [Agrocybe pediades]|uniref:Uncharacterized protein n=1 Tax=Agrocybe pediades TaxID=84607 RepID=A0A8H4QSA9_9AGAR|nr:hypothetical protein D9613_012419 [Agrocybe pediades]